MITDITALTVWIQSVLPPVDPDRYEPWQAAPAEDAALTAEIRVQVESPGYTPRALTVTLTARPISERQSSEPAPAACCPTEEPPHEF